MVSFSGLAAPCSFVTTAGPPQTAHVTPFPLPPANSSRFFLPHALGHPHVTWGKADPVSSIQPDVESHSLESN